MRISKQVLKTVISIFFERERGYVGCDRCQFLLYYIVVLLLCSDFWWDLFTVFKVRNFSIIHLLRRTVLLLVLFLSLDINFTVLLKSLRNASFILCDFIQVLLSMFLRRYRSYYFAHASWAFKIPTSLRMSRH